MAGVHRRGLVDNYTRWKPRLGRPRTDVISGEMYLALWNEFVGVAATTASIDTGLGDHGVQPPPLAVQGSPPVSRLFSLDKYSSLRLLVATTWR